jgi:multidrug efflux system outer membrane protein
VRRKRQRRGRRQERTLAQSEAALAQSDALVTTYQIAVFQALGGGW